MLTDQMRERIWNHYDRDGMRMPHVDTFRGAIPFGDIPERIQETVLHQLLINIAPMPSYNNWSKAKPSLSQPYFIRSHEIGDLLYFFMGISLTDAQVQEALLSLGIEPVSGWQEDCEYRVYPDCPWASLALDGRGGLKTVDRRHHVPARRE